MMEQVDEIIKSIVEKEPGIKGMKLVLDLLRKCFDEKIDIGDSNSHTITNRIDFLVDHSSLIEIEYTLPGTERVKSMYFPAETEIKVVV